MDDRVRIPGWDFAPKLSTSRILLSPRSCSRGSDACRFEWQRHRRRMPAGLHV